MTSVFETCPYCRNSSKLRPHCKNCGGAGGSYTTPAPKAPTPVPQSPENVVCVWCGQRYEEHLDGRLPGAPVPRMPCLGLKVGFRPREVRRG